ncbi:MULTISPECIES: ABC transporter substrate-binding protein [Chromohalobacter]|uniref:ABC transporter substrate-binding protein n=1 Tax=Chromohalobacter TaxID=42054 RepID=UPI000554E3E9|nr:MULTISPECIES: iron-siderophore ABC transporter substrate-binding protein [Chromohalobacter]MDF9434077.1 iron-siderophore ABC transporter substrate-binding protein [Chromohalobacter israelensis]MDO0945846.1 iron-siderophore ABC transporter substrate-binding protein [Chromohalobacter salexigens]NQY45003.1 iron-siderophore ABC transporter substrate-binding protein [Chromohalobacter sp.]
MTSLRHLCMATAGIAALSATLPADARSLETAYGTVEVADDPARVVTLYTNALDTSLTAGVKPLGAVATRGGDGVARYFGEQADGIEIVGTPRETNIEAVAALAPDVILASPQLPEAQYELLSRIAPTVVPDVEPYQMESWENEARVYGKALGRSDTIDDAIAEIDAKAEALSERQNGSPTASLIRWMPQGAIVMADNIFASTLLTKSGFTVDDGDTVKEGRPHSDPLSLENLSRIDNDWLFLATLNAEGDEAYEAARQSPAFERLDVVQRDRVVSVDGQLWTSATGPMAAKAILDDIASAMDAAQ